ncbi:unnamed protein product [Lymnaea stagnalis]|uniref:Kazal-like domain-containing protein n=1 Tax=Lymnaea stagnalis TaxID=6523 RepID=A0AAV2HS44_LYMST
MTVVGSSTRACMSLATVLVLCLCVPATRAQAVYNKIRCGECDVAKCPELHYCEGEPIKDHCGCCTICSSSKFQPHVMVTQDPEGKACDQVQCPKMKVCVENMQGLPLCTCPGAYVCRNAKRRDVCGTDGKTYPSRCLMKIASCNKGVVVRKKFRGVCKEDEEPVPDVAVIKQKLKNPKKMSKKKGKQVKVESDVERERRRKKRKEMRRRRRRKSGGSRSRAKSRSRRHRVKGQKTGSTFDETFAHYTWTA